MSKRNQFNARLASFPCLVELHGIHKQASVGFLTLMESLRYCKVTKLNCSYGTQKGERKIYVSFFLTVVIKLHEVLDSQDFRCLKKDQF